MGREPLDGSIRPATGWVRLLFNKTLAINKVTKGNGTILGLSSVTSATTHLWSRWSRYRSELGAVNIQLTQGMVATRVS